jgi:hypothetical protein
VKNLQNSKAREQGKKDLRRVFGECKFIDALTLGEGDPPTADDFIFYYDKARNGQIGNYVIYEVISTDANTRADDAVVGRDFLAAIDVFSVKSFESKLLQDTLALLEEKLLAAGFLVTAESEDYEPDTRLYRQVLYASKLYA